MNRARRKIVFRLLIFTAPILIAMVVFLNFGHQKPLTPNETALVGSWSQKSIPDQTTLSVMEFGPDRTFRTQNGEFTGRWWISAGQLNLKLWRDEEPTNLPAVANALILPFANAWKDARADTETWQITFDETGDHVKLGQPGTPPESVLIRMH